ncbi:30118_t:CDS:2, partial [Racocetra persica]
SFKSDKHSSIKSDVNDSIKSDKNGSTRMGGTHIYATLEWVFESSLPKRSTSVILFSDFETSSSTADKIVKLVEDNQKNHDNQKEKHDLRIFSMVMSNIVSNHLAESIARV